jgi:hypothetical protein
MSEPVLAKAEVDIDNKTLTITSIRLLDYFAGQALASLNFYGIDPEFAAGECYNMAEKMLTERERRQEGSKETK